MNRTSILNLLFWSLSFGGVIAILAGERRAVSLRIWLASLVIWFALASVRRLLDHLPLAPERVRSLFGVRRKPPPVDATRLRELRALEGLLIRSTTNDRAYVQQLHPRVVALADHFLPVTHGINRQAEPERVESLLGPLVWMLDPDVRHRTPTLDELGEFVDLVTTATTMPTEEAA